MAKAPVKSGRRATKTASKPEVGSAAAIEAIENAIKAGQVVRVQAPSFSASSIALARSSNEWVLTFSQAHPAIAGASGTPNVAALEPVLVLHLSPQTAKDLSLVMASEVANHEKDLGVIETDYTKRHSAR